MKKISIFLLLCFCVIDFAVAQSGPGGIGDVSGNSILQLWLRGDAGIVVNPSSPGRVKQWLDQSGANNHVSSTGGSKPFYVTTPGASGAKFSGRHYLQAPASASFFQPTATIFIVKKKEFTGTAISLSPNGYSQELLILDKRIYHHHSSGNYIAQSSACLNSMPESELCIVAGVWGAGTTDITYYINGLLSTDTKDPQGVQLPLSPINRKITIGQRDVFTSSEYLVGTILEVIGYNVKLTDDERMAVENYLACKYDINNDICGALNPCEGKMDEMTKVELEDVLTVYPNPVSGQLNVHFGKSIQGKNIKLSIMNVMGQTIRSQQINPHETNGTLTLSVQDLTPGNYLLIAEQGTTIMTRKFVVQ
ncbi:MAG: T9SS type A sorting domain-containing protein [Chitinophagales bacterium]